MNDFEARIDGLYSTLHDQSEFDTALQKLQESVRANAFHLLVIDPVTLTPITGLCPAIPEGHDTYVAQYAAIDPRLKFSAGDSFRAIDINSPFRESEHRHSPVYHEFLKEFDAQIGASVVKRLNSSATLVFSSFRPTSFDEYKEDEISKVEFIARNLVRILSFKELQGLGTSAKEPSITINVNASKRILSTSENADHELNNYKTPIKISSQKLWSTERTSNIKLQEALDAVISGNKHLSEDVVIRNLSGEPYYIATVQANRKDRVLDILQCAPRATVRFKKLHPKLCVSESLLKDIFDLTPTEAATLSFLCQGVSSHDIGIIRGVAISTVRWTIRNLIEKFEVGSQTELIAKVLCMPGVLK